MNMQKMDSIIVQYNLEHLEYNNIELELMFNTVIKSIDMIIVSHVKSDATKPDELTMIETNESITMESNESTTATPQQCLNHDSNEFDIMLTLLNITIHTFIKLQDDQFFIEFIVYNNKNNFVSCNDNPICCMSIEMDMLINLTYPLEFVNMPCIQSKLNASALDAENIALIKFMQFCSNFANVLNMEKNNIDMMMTSNHYFDTTFTEVFNSIASN